MRSIPTVPHEGYPQCLEMPLFSYVPECFFVDNLLHINEYCELSVISLPSFVSKL
jgi:hypothetical protein